MPTYISILRGINVSGSNKIPMAQLKALYESLDFTDVKTYIQSGNVVFHSSHRITKASLNSLHNAMVKTVGFSVPIAIMTKSELKTIIDHNPYLKKDKIDASKLHVTFLLDVPNKTALEKLNAIDSGSDTFHINGKVIYLYCPNGYGRTKLTNNYFERMLAVNATTRNWKTTNVLYSMAK